MRETKPFYPSGKTIAVAADAVAPTGVATVAPDNQTSQSCQYRVMNNGSATIWFSYGVDAATAAANAVIPTGGGTNSKDSYPIPASAIEVITAPRNSFFSGIAAAPQTLYVTPGEGV